MTVVLHIVVGTLLLIGSVLVLGYAIRSDRREDLGRVSDGYMRVRGWDKR